MSNRQPFSGSATNLTELLAQRAAQYPDQQPYTHLFEFGAQQQTLTYGELDRQARAIAFRLQSAAEPGDRAILLFAPGLEFVSAFFGVLYAGLVPVPVIPPRPGQSTTTLAAILVDAASNLILTTRASFARAQAQYGDSGYLEMFQWVLVDDLSEPAPAHWQPVTAQPDDLALLVYTSGSTSFPKGVMLSHANILSHLHAANQVFKPTPRERIVTWMPLFHVAGLIGSVLHPLYSNLDVVILSPLEVLERPAYWLEQISTRQAGISGGPNFMYQLCVDHVTPAECASLDVSAWRIAFLGAEPIRPETLAQFVEKFRPYGFHSEALHTTYGLSEATMFVTFHRGGSPPKTLTLDRVELKQNRVHIVQDDGGLKLMSAGPVPLDTTLYIVEPTTRELCPPERIGEIWVASPTVAKGYWNHPEETEETFGAFTADGQGPFLRTGDLGFLHDDELYITGRLKELIIVRGKNYYAQDVEAAVAEAHPALQRGASAAFGITIDGVEEIVLMHELQPEAADVDVDQVAQAIRQIAASSLQVPLYAVVLVENNSLPRTPTGKIQRFLCREEFLSTQV